MTAPEKAPHPVIRTIKPYVKESRVDGWLCIKYLDCGEESMSTFADVSKGDIIMYGNATRSRPAKESSEVLDRLVEMIDAHAENWDELCELQEFIRELRQQKGQPE